MLDFFIGVSANGSLIQRIYIYWCRKNSQHYMLANPDFKNISMENYKREIFPTFMLELRLYVIHSLNWLYVEVPYALARTILKTNSRFCLRSDYIRCISSSNTPPLSTTLHLPRGRWWPIVYPPVCSIFTTRKGVCLQQYIVYLRY